jgi:hypothetical protein
MTVVLGYRVRARIAINGTYYRIQTNPRIRSLYRYIEDHEPYLVDLEATIVSAYGRCTFSKVVAGLGYKQPHAGAAYACKLCSGPGTGFLMPQGCVWLRVSE